MLGNRGCFEHWHHVLLGVFEGELPVAPEIQVEDWALKTEDVNVPNNFNDGFKQFGVHLAVHFHYAKVTRPCSTPVY
jgi:hypothetical protein